MSHLQRNGDNDLLFPLSESGQGRFDNMTVATFSGANASQRMATFIREYTNRDGTQGLPPAHIGATSPYIDGGNLFYIYFQDNANKAFTLAEFPGTSVDDVWNDNTDIKLASLNATRLLAVADNKTLIARLQGSDTGWRN